VYNSFRGLRRFNAFIDDVQQEFAVCFSLRDREAHYPLARFVERIGELERSPRGSLASLKNQVRAGPGWHVMVLANIPLLIPVAWLRDSSWALVAWLVLVVLVNGLFVRFALRARTYHARLLKRIEASEAARP
jgi:hypothetical protein